MDNVTIAIGTTSGAAIGVGAHIKGIVASVTLAQATGIIPAATILSTVIVATIGAITGFFVTLFCKWIVGIIKKNMYESKTNKKFR